MFKTIYAAGLIGIAIIRIVYRWRVRTTLVAQSRVTMLERVLLSQLVIGMLGIPLLSAFTPWLDFADVRLPAWAGWLGVLLFAWALWVLWSAHAALGRNWSDSLEVRQDHQLITTGPYAYIRHPMYAFGWLWCMAQILLLQNWIAAASSIASYMLFYVLRVPAEEEMMRDRFGEVYGAHMQRTGRILPRLR